MSRTSRASRWISWARLHGQRLASRRMAGAEDIVGWLGAVQAQEYPLAKWGLGLRLRRATDASIERAFAAGSILRTHVLRPTWHFVTPADIRWMLALTGPRIRANVASYDRQLGIDPGAITRAIRAIAAALEGGAQLTRIELKAVLTRAGLNTHGTQRLTHLIIHAELDAVICSGARRANLQTYALLDDRVPRSRPRSRDDSLAELARRYFTGHGPAQLKDFSWWSGLTAGDARTALALSRHHLEEKEVEGRTYWFSASLGSVERPERAAYLLPPYDEYLIAYKDRSAALDSALWDAVVSWDPFSAPIVVDGCVVGGWKRTVEKGTVRLRLDLPRKLSRADSRLVDDAVGRHQAFLG